MPGQCYLLVAPASTIMNPSYIKNMMAADASIHELEAPTLIVSNTAY